MFIKKLTVHKLCLISIALTVSLIKFAFASEYDGSFPEFQSLSERVRSPLVTLLRDPALALEDLQAVKHSVQHRLDHEADSGASTKVAKMLAAYAAGQEESPIFLLDECDAGQCVLTRSNTGEYRAVYEDLVVQQLVQLMVKKPLVRYVSFGSGKMFQDLVIFAKAFARKSDGRVIIHLIESGYSFFCKYREALQESPEINPDAPALQNFDAQAFERICTGLNREDLQTIIAQDCVLVEQTARQFLTFLRKTFVQAHVSLLLHQSKQDYLTYREKQGMPYPDILTSADIQDDRSFALQGIFDFRELCQKVLENNPHVHTSLLALPGSLATFFLSQEGKLLDQICTISTPYLMLRRFLPYACVLLIMAAISYTDCIQKSQ